MNEVQEKEVVQKATRIEQNTEIKKESETDKDKLAYINV